MHGFVEDQTERDTRATLLSWGLGLAMLVVPLLAMLILLEAGIHFGETFIAPEALTPNPETPLPPQPNRDR